jgi:hypothetical protein
VRDRKEWVQQNLSSITKRIVSAKTFENAKDIAQHVWSNEASRWVLESCTETQKEISFEAFGWGWRGKLDIYGDSILVSDMKLTVDAEYKKFHRQIEYMGYLTQAAIYTIGAGIDLPFFFTGYDRSGHVTVMEVPKAVLNQAWERLGDIMKMFEKCIALDEWNKSYDFWATNGIYKY